MILITVLQGENTTRVSLTSFLSGIPLVNMTYDFSSYDATNS